jgi:hypothetical protein
MTHVTRGLGNVFKQTCRRCMSTYKKLVTDEPIKHVQKMLVNLADGQLMEIRVVTRIKLTPVHRQDIDARYVVNEPTIRLGKPTTTPIKTEPNDMFLL